jgi:hypothetical protein
MSRSLPRKKARFTGPEAPATPPLTPPLTKTKNQALRLRTTRTQPLLPQPELQIHRRLSLPLLHQHPTAAAAAIFARLREMERIVASDDLHPTTEIGPSINPAPMGVTPLELL